MSLFKIHRLMNKKYTNCLEGVWNIIFWMGFISNFFKYIGCTWRQEYGMKSFPNTHPLPKRKMKKNCTTNFCFYFGVFFFNSILLISSKIISFFFFRFKLLKIFLKNKIGDDMYYIYVLYIYLNYLTDRKNDCLINWQTDKQTDRWEDSRIELQTDPNSELIVYCRYWSMIIDLVQYH